MRSRVPAAVVLAAVLTGTAACGGGSTTPPPSPPSSKPAVAAPASSPPSAAPSPADVSSLQLRRAATLSVTPPQACRQARAAYAAFVTAAEHGNAPDAQTAVRAKLETVTRGAATLAMGVTDPAIASALQDVADTGTAYLAVPDLTTAEREGRAVTEAAGRLDDLCG